MIPLFQGYVLAGEFQRIERIQRAILLNVPIFLMYFLSFIALLLLLYFLDDSKHNILNQQGILAVVIAICLAAGCTLLVCFLGYGLVKIPVQTWVQSDYTDKLNRLLFKVATYEDQIIEQQNKVQVLFNIARQVKVEEDNEQFREIMLAEIDEFMLEMQQYDFNPRSNSFLDSDSKLHDKYLKGNRDVGYQKLVQLNAEMRSKSTVLRRLCSSRQEHIKAATITEDIINAQRNNTSPMQPIEGPYFKKRNPFNSKLDKIWLKFEYHWYIQNNRGKCMKVLAILFGALSFITVLTEVLFFFGEFEKTGLRQSFVDANQERSYFTQNVSDRISTAMTDPIYSHRSSI